MADIGFFHPNRGYWQAVDVSTDPYTIIVEPERTETDVDGNETIIPAVTRETTQLAELLAGYPSGTIEVPLKPGADYEWQEDSWVYIEPASVIPDSVSARQFKLQLLAAGLLDQVESWVASQDQAVQIAYANSGTFVREEPMMQSGFQALGFTEAQIDGFFTEAADL